MNELQRFLEIEQRINGEDLLCKTGDTRQG